jgi:hypothetical protein
LADLEVEESNDANPGVWTRGLLIRRRIADGDFAYFTTWCPESELGVLASQCLNRRIADKKILAREVNAWQDHRNKHHAKANWQFKTADARVKLKRLYPQFE